MTKKSLDAHEVFHETGLYIPNRTLYLDLDESADGEGVEVGPKSASRLIKNLVHLNALSHDPITILMNCPGGSVTDGFAIYDAIKASPSHITIQVLGEATSMGAIILQAADTRVIYPYGRIMVHDGSMAIAGNIRDVEKAVEDTRRERLLIYGIFAERTGKPKSYWNRRLAADYYVNANEALREGLVDEIYNARTL